MDKIKTGNLIRDARNKKGYTQSELGALIGVSNKAISRWENGEAFPDVGVLEGLSNELGLEIRDIVVGEKNNDSTDVLTEIARVAKLQEKEKQKRNVCWIVLISSAAIFMLIGTAVFSGRLSLSVVQFYILMCLIVCFVLFLTMDCNKKIMHFEGKKDKWITAISGVSGIYSVIMVWASFAWASGRTVPPHIGVVVNYQLFALFLVNVLLLFCSCYSMLFKNKMSSAGIPAMLFTVFVTMDYSDLLYRINSFEEVMRYFYRRTGMVLGIIVICFLAIFLFKRKRG